MREKSSSPKLMVTIVLSIAISMAAYTSTSAFGLLTFGSKIQADLLTNYDANNGLILLGIVGMAAKTVTTYPLLLFCARVALEDMWTELRGHSPTEAVAAVRRHVIVLIWFFSSLVIAVAVPDIGTAIDMLGALASLFIFIVPGMCFMRATLRKDPNLVLLKDRLYIFLSCLYICLGSFIFGLTLTQTILKDFVQDPVKKLSLCTQR
jgi:amino acid permease